MAEQEPMIPNYKNIYLDIISKKFPSKTDTYEKILSKKILSNYDFLAELDSAGWYEQLFAREQLFLMLSYRKNSKRPFSEEDLVYRAAVEIWDKAYISLKDSTVLSAMCGHDGANGRCGA